MDKIESMLSKGKNQMDQLEIPEQLETRLISALQYKAGGKGKGKTWIAKIAVAAVLLLLLAYQSDTLAFYGKKLVGYDPVMNLTLQRLNDLGKGQEIGKSYTLKDGVTVSLDGVMLDDNQLLAFFTLKDPRGKVDDALSPFISMRGLFSDYIMKSSSGTMNEAQTEMKLIGSFPPPLFFEKKLTLHFSDLNGIKSESGGITFILDRNQAMGHTLKQALNQTVQLDGENLKFDSISASPTTTVIKGSIEGSLALAMSQLQGDHLRLNQMEIKLIADGKEVAAQGGGENTGLNGVTFERDFDALPPGLKQLQIEIGSFVAEHNADSQIELPQGLKDQMSTVQGQTLTVNNVYESQGDTYVTISTEQDVILTKVYLLEDNKSAQLQDTRSDSHDKLPDGRITHTRTLHFPGTGKSLELDIKGMSYAKNYGRVIDIPLN